MSSKELKESEINSVITLFSKGNFNEAFNIVTELTESFPDNPILHNIRGACYAGLGQLTSAINSYKTAISLNPKYGKAYFNLGGAYHELGDYDNSVKSYEASLSINPDYAEAFNNLGNVLSDSGMLEEAIHSFKEALVIKPDYVEASYSLGVILHEIGNLEDAVIAYQDAIKTNPNFSEAHNNLGNAYKDLGKPDIALKSYQRALKINPNFSEAHNNLGNVYKEIGQLEDAVDSYQKALEINPDYPALHNNLGNAFYELDRLQESVNSFESALSYNPDYVDSLNNLGIVFSELGETDRAIKSFEKAIAIKPDYADAYNNLGNALKDISQLDRAVKSYENAIDLKLDFAEAYNNLGNVLKDLDRLNEAFDCFEKAIKISPNFAEAHNNLGNTLSYLDQLDDAVLSFETAIKIDPNFSEAYNNLGNVLKDLDRLNEAFDCFEKALKINPNFPEAHNNFGALLKDLNQLKKARKSIEKAIEINPNFAEAYHNLGNVFKDLDLLDEALKSYQKAKTLRDDLDYILGNIITTKMNFCSWESLPILFNELSEKIHDNRKVIDPFTLFSLIDDPALQKRAAEIRINSHHPKIDTLQNILDYNLHSKIRIGYFSADFREHPLAYLTAELYELHDRDHFEIHAFSFGKDTNDELNLRIKAGVDYFHNVDLMSHKEIVLLARSLEIDIAVDLAGFTAGAKTEVFAMSAAPIQLSYIGYLGTMGADYYDYLIADPMMIPQESQKHYVEKIVYLPSFQVNDSKDLPPEITLTRKEVGLPDKGFVFCCFNNTYKFTPTVFDSWARILKAVEGSILIVYASNESSKTNLKKEILNRGVETDRLIFGDSISKPKYLARYRVADLFLDTHPYNAGTTASDALKMGVPMLTYIGRSYQARMGASILNSINLPELITNSLEEYESLAIELASNPDKLKKIKDKLQSNLTTAPLFNTPLFTKNIESAYTQMYERHHAGLEPDHIYVE